ncbi:hypothetical protein SADUNF_Sadunf07G0005700 [Salix dunnii]|uniref:Protein PHLOEM PROTEIN 2-LIKE A10 n=1 Tax=Salix dunnii TaxID=1413687 RepID=A0A835MTD2_9ROSI|nr:hypothetical protein SADUNF_Sadunf07G0005700 [Salix dunnii]
MDLQLVRKGLLNDTRRKKRWALLLAALGFSTYTAYKVYHFPSLAEKRKRVSKIFGAFAAAVEAISDSANTIGVVSKDFKDFVQSESDQIPNSFKQISKVARSNEFSDALVTLTQALTVGILRGYQANARRIDHDAGSNGNGSPSILDEVFDKLCSSAGSGFVSVVVGSFARNLVLGFCEGGLNSNSDLNASATGTDDHDSARKLVDVVCGDKCKELIGDCIQLFVSTAVAVYLDKTMHINTYDDFFAGLTNPKHETKVREVLVSVCNDGIETLVKTSHQVLTTDDISKNSSFDSPYLAVDQGESEMEGELCGKEAICSDSKAKKSFDEVKENGWVNKVSSALAVPSNRRLVLDVTGRVTFETVRSFLEFLLEKLYNGIRRCVDTVHELLVDSGLEVVRYVNAKSSVIATVCISLCLHVLDGYWILAPA